MHILPVKCQILVTACGHWSRGWHIEVSPFQQPSQMEVSWKGSPLTPVILIFSLHWHGTCSSSYSWVCCHCQKNEFLFWWQPTHQLQMFDKLVFLSSLTPKVPGFEVCADWLRSAGRTSKGSNFWSRGALCLEEVWVAAISMTAASSLASG